MMLGTTRAEEVREAIQETYSQHCSQLVHVPLWCGIGDTARKVSVTLTCMELRYRTNGAEMAADVLFRGLAWHQHGMVL